MKNGIPVMATGVDMTSMIGGCGNTSVGVGMGALVAVGSGVGLTARVAVDATVGAALVDDGCRIFVVGVNDAAHPARSTDVARSSARIRCDMV